MCAAVNTFEAVRYCPESRQGEKGKLINFLKPNWAENAYLLVNLGEFHPRGISWLVAQKEDETAKLINAIQQPDSPYSVYPSNPTIIALVMAYKDYRIYPAGDPKKVRQIIGQIIEELPGKPIKDKKVFTLVSSDPIAILPPNCEAVGEVESHLRLGITEQSFASNSRRLKNILTTSNGIIDAKVLKMFAQNLHINLPQKTQVKMVDTADAVSDVLSLVATPIEYNGQPNSTGDDVFIDPDKINSGRLPYLGLYIDDELVAVTGTHGILNSEKGIAVFGDAFTRPDQRQKGYATLLTGALLNMYFDRGIQYVAADIRSDKPWSSTLQEKIGFEKQGQVNYQNVVSV